jgi:hypothetical protein
MKRLKRMERNAKDVGQYAAKYQVITMSAEIVWVAVACMQIGAWPRVSCGTGKSKVK